MGLGWVDLDGVVFVSVLGSDKTKERREGRGGEKGGGEERRVVASLRLS